MTSMKPSPGSPFHYSPADELEFTGHMQATALDIVAYAPGFEEMELPQMQDIILNYISRETQASLEVPTPADLQEDAMAWMQMDREDITEQLLRRKLLNPRQQQEAENIFALAGKAGQDPERMADITDKYMAQLSERNLFGCDERDMLLCIAIAGKYLYAYWFDALLNPRHPAMERWQPGAERLEASVKAGMAGFLAQSGGVADLLEDGIAGAALYSLYTVAQQD